MNAEHHANEPRRCAPRSTPYDDLADEVAQLNRAVKIDVAVAALGAHLAAMPYDVRVEVVARLIDAAGLGHEWQRTHTNARDARKEE